MSMPLTTPRDAVFRRVDWALSRACTMLTILLVPIVMARLPHALDAGLAVIALHGVALLFNLLVRLAQRINLVGPDTLDRGNPTTFIESPAVPIRASAAPIATPISATPTLDRLQTNAAARCHTIDVPGRGRIVYWSEGAHGTCRES